MTWDSYVSDAAAAAAAAATAAANDAIDAARQCD